MSDDLAYWQKQRGIREDAVKRAKADYMGAGHNTYAQALRTWEAAKRHLAEADERIRELELARREPGKGES